MVLIHAIVGVTLTAANLIAAIWGGYEWLTRRHSAGFWYVLRLAQVAVVVQVGLGGLLVLLGHVAADLHYLYGALGLVVSLLAELTRAGAAQYEIADADFHALPEERQHEIGMAIVRREVGIMAVSSIVIFFLALRAIGITPLL